MSNSDGHSRRKFIAATAVLAGIGLAGCAGDDDEANGNDPTPTPEPTPTPTPSPTPPPEGRDVIETTVDSPKETKDGLLVNVPSIIIDNEAIVWDDAEFGGGEQKISASAEEMIVIVEFYAENVADEPQNLPNQRNIALVMDDDQYSPEFVNVDEIREPVDGPYYQQLRDARSGVNEEGYIVYKTKRHDGEIDVSWWPEQLFYDLEEITWRGEVEGSNLPAIELTDIQIPEATQVGTVTVELTWQNSGGQHGEVTAPIFVDWPEGWEDDGEISATVPGGETVTEEFDLITNALGTTEVHVDGDVYTIEVEPREFSFGEGTELPSIPQIIAEEPVFSDHITMDAFDPDPEYAQDEYEFAVIPIAMKNGSDESLDRPCRDDFDLVVDGQSYSPYDTGFSSEMLEPLESEELGSCFGVGDIDQDSEINGVIAFEIPIDRSELLLETRWSFSGFNQPDTGLIWRY